MENPIPESKEVPEVEVLKQAKEDESKAVKNGDATESSMNGSDKEKVDGDLQQPESKTDAVTENGTKDNEDGSAIEVCGIKRKSDADTAVVDSIEVTEKKPKLDDAADVAEEGDGETNGDGDEEGDGETNGDGDEEA